MGRVAATEEEVQLEGRALGRLRRCSTELGEEEGSRTRGTRGVDLEAGVVRMVLRGTGVSRIEDQSLQVEGEQRLGRG